MNEIAAIKARLARAVMTLQALPSNARERPSGDICGWPEMIRKSKTGAILRCGDMKFNPSNQDISDCYRIIDALCDMSELQRRLLFARAAGVPWQALMIRTGRSRTHLNRLHHRALTELAEKFHQDKKITA